VGASPVRYSPSKQYLTAGIIAAVLAVFSGVWATSWIVALIASVLFTLSALAVFLLAFQPAIEIQEENLMIGRRAIPWSDIRRVDRTGWISPLGVYLTLTTGRRVLLVYPGDLDSSNQLLRQVRRASREALIDGVPYRQFWGDALPAAPERRQLPSPRYQLLRTEDEVEVERLYQQLKTVGRMDSKSSSDEK
jgi:hypothetical protein